MDSTLLIAIVTGLCTAVPSIIATFVMNNARDAVQTERLNNAMLKIDDLANKVNDLLNYDKRISLLEHEFENISHALERMNNDGR